MTGKKPKLFQQSLSFIVIISALLLLASCGKDTEQQAPARAIEIKVASVTRADVPVSMEFVGQTKGSVDAEIRARVEGVITAIKFDEGKEVQEGQLLYTIDSAPYRAKVAEAKAKLAEAQTKLTKAESDLKRVRPLVEMKALSARDLDTAIANQGTAQGSVDAAKAALEANEIELSYCEVFSPTKGIIGFTKAKVGEFVGRPPNPVILNTVSNLDPIHVQFAITEKDYLYFARMREEELAKNGEATKHVLKLVLADGKEYPHAGAVASVNREIDSKTGTLSVEAAFPNSNKLVRPGQFAKIRTVAETLRGALVVPKKALLDLQGQPQLIVINKENRVEVRNVKLGRLVGDSQIVEEGVVENDLVAVEALDRLRTGTVVVPKIQPTV